MSDVIFNLGTRQIPAHKFVLASASPVLFQQLYGEESSSKPGQLNRQNLCRISATSSIGDHFSSQLSGRLHSFGGGSRAGSIVSWAHSSNNAPMSDTYNVQTGIEVVHVEVANHDFDDFYELIRF